MSHNDKVGIKKRHLVIVAIVLVFTIGTTYFLSDRLTEKNISNFINVLIASAGMVFTIAGIWVAYIYPQAVTSIITKKSSPSLLDNEDYQRVSVIVGVIVISGCVLTASLTVSYLILVTPVSELPPAITKILKGGAYLTITLLFFAQAIAIYVVLASCINFINDLNKKNTKQNLRNKLGIVSNPGPQKGNDNYKK